MGDTSISTIVSSSIFAEVTASSARSSSDPLRPFPVNAPVVAIAVGLVSSQVALPPPSVVSTWPGAPMASVTVKAPMVTVDVVERVPVIVVFPEALSLIHV